MNELIDTYQDFDDDSMFAFSVAANIAIVGNSVPESVLSLYLAPLTQVIDKNMLVCSLAYFHGANILHVECDCIGYNEECLADATERNQYFFSGIEERVENTETYQFAINQVDRLRNLLY